MADDFTAGYATALKHEIEHWDAQLWHTAFTYESEREYHGDDHEFAHTGVAASLWQDAHYKRAQIERLTGAYEALAADPRHG